jgi:mono/diheme cytochrome c family protein
MRAAAAALLVVALAGDGVATAGESVEYVYRLHCSGCHGTEGAGSKVGRIPPFVGIVGHFASTPEGRLYLVRVPGVANAGLSDAETARMLNYVLQTWGRPEMPSDIRAFTAEEVHGFRDVHVDDIVRLRQKLAAELAQRGLSTDY